MRVADGAGVSSNSGRFHGARGTNFQHDVRKAASSRGVEISSFRRFQRNRSLGLNLKKI
jgi:hypothetical protein